MNAHRRANFEKLLGVLRYDARKRLEVLREELNYLVNSIRYRLNGITEIEGARLLDAAAPTSHDAFLFRLCTSAESLLGECEKDIQELNSVELLYSNHEDHFASGNGLQSYQCFQIVWNAKVVNKALVLTERLGDLHDRLEQFLQRTNPDHPDPTLRRRAEQGLTDKYLSELTRWIHRDLSRLARRVDGQYPYEAVPSTYQFWAYDHTSRHHAFMSLDDHRKWVQKVTTGDPNSLEAHSRFVSVALSYWIPERLALVPIIGHELAHQVLRAIYGREVNFAMIEQDTGELGRLYRRLTRTVEAWLSRRVQREFLDARIVSNLVTEIMCDVLAAVRFGYAYAYAWMLETLSEESFSHLFHDQYGMLRRAEAENTVDLRGQIDSMQRDAASLSGYLRRKFTCTPLPRPSANRRLAALELRKRPNCKRVWRRVRDPLDGATRDLHRGRED